MFTLLLMLTYFYHRIPWSPLERIKVWFLISDRLVFIINRRWTLFAVVFKTELISSFPHFWDVLNFVISKMLPKNFQIAHTLPFTSSQSKQTRLFKLIGQDQKFQQIELLDKADINIMLLLILEGLQLFTIQHWQYFMESSAPSAVSMQKKNQEVYNAIVNGMAQYEKDRSKGQVWGRVFWTIGVYFGKEGTISTEAQKLLNFYLQNKSQSSQLGGLISQNKELICKMYDFALSSAESIDQAISTGSISQAVVKKFQKNFENDHGHHSMGLKVLIYSVEIVVIHFCEFLQRFKNANGTNILSSRRTIPKIIRRKHLGSISKNADFIDELFKEPATMLQGFLDIVKPILASNLNIESLFEVTHPQFRNKKGLINGVTESADDRNSEYMGKIVNMNTIFDCTYAGREMIESKLNQLKISDEPGSNLDEKWSILICITELEFKIQVMIEKLPLFMRPKTSGDILSYCRKQVIPTFRYQVMKPGFVDRPIFSQFMTLFLNVGRSHFQILCFENRPEVVNELVKHDKSNILERIDKMNIAYSKLRVGPKSMVLVPNNNYYVLAADTKNPNVLTQIVFWSVLPKYPQPMKRCLSALQSKSKQFRSYAFLPIEQILFDYLSHEYLLMLHQSELMTTITEFLSSRLNKEQTNLQMLASRNPELVIQPHNLSYLNRSCVNCKGSIVNYFCRTDRRENICMACANVMGVQEQKKIEYAAYMHDPRTLRYPITVSKILIEKRKHPGEKVENPYEKHVCGGHFIGSINSEACKAENKEQEKDHLAGAFRKDEIHFSNRLKEQRIVSIDELLASIALSQPKNAEDREVMIEKIRSYIKQISEPESFIKSISVNWSKDNLVSDLMWAYRASQTQIFPN